MSIPWPRPATLAVALGFSIALHLAALAWLQPRSTPQRTAPEFPLSVTLLQPEAPVLKIPVVQPKRAERALPAPKADARPQPVPIPLPQPEQPLRMRVVAVPSDYAATASSPEHRYAWPGEVDASPLPQGGIAIHYPPAALRNFEKALVVVRLDIDRAGGVERLQILCSAPEFDEAVRSALAAARFRPAFVKEKRVPSWILLEIAFLADEREGKDPGTAERALAVLQKRCLNDLAASAQPAR